MILRRRTAIYFIAFCTFVLLGLFFYSSGSTGKCIMSSRQKEAVLNLQNVLSVMEKDSSRYNKEITVKLTEAVHVLSAEVAEESPIEQLTKSLTLNKDNSPLYACPEKFRHAKYGHPYFVSGPWVTEDCGDVEPISKTLTIVFVASKDHPCSVADNKVILRVLKLYPDLPIVIGAPDGSKCTSYGPNIQIVKFLSEKKLGDKLNSLIKEVQTPLTLIARSLDDFNWLARLERQLSVFSTEPSAVIVGGSVRNKTGHWQAGCYQTDLKQYILKYIEGYYGSKHECMYCEYLVGPFIAKSRFLRAHAFDIYLGDDVVFEDFFLGIKLESILACPDVMYHSTDSGIERRRNQRVTWLSLVEKWGLNRIILSDGTTHKFSCKESALNCATDARESGAMMMPICCRDGLVNGFKAFHAFCVKHNVAYQIEGGSTLGAVKLSDVIPWDLDGDASYYQDKMKLFSKSINLTTSDGEVYIDHINMIRPGFFYVSTPQAFIELSAMPKMSADLSNLTDIFHDTPTLIRIGDAWVYAPFSPGLYARNFYGNEMLRHSNNYRHLGRKHWYSPYNVSDPFIKCKTKHHGCLDQFLSDGSIQFKIPEA